MLTKTLASLGILLILSTSVYGVEFSELNPVDQMKLQAIADAQRDASRNTSQIWGLVGCFGGILGISVAFAYPSPIPAAALIGKPPEYVAYYSDEYRRSAQNTQVKYAAGGCLAGSMFVVMVLVVNEY